MLAMKLGCYAVGRADRAAMIILQALVFTAGICHCLRREQEEHYFLL